MIIIGCKAEDKRAGPVEYIDGHKNHFTTSAHAPLIALNDKTSKNINIINQTTAKM